MIIKLKAKQNSKQIDILSTLSVAVWLRSISHDRPTRKFRTDRKLIMNELKGELFTQILEPLSFV